MVAVTSLPPEDRPPMRTRDPAHSAKARRSLAVAIVIVVVIAIAVALVLLL